MVAELNSIRSALRFNPFQATQSTVAPRSLFSPRRTLYPVETAMEDCLKVVRATTKSGRAYSVHARRLLQHFAGRDLGTVTPQELEHWRARRLNGEFSGGRRPALGTVNHELAFLSKVFQHAMAAGHTSFNPVSCLDWLPHGEPRDRWLTPEEEERLRATMAPEDFDIVRFAILTGMRRGEIFGLRRQDIRGRFVRLQASRTKTERARWVPLNDEAVAIIERHLQAGALHIFKPHGVNRYCFAHSWVRDVFKPALEAAGIEREFQFRDLRRTCGTRLAMNGENAHTIQHYLGHTNSRQTDQYVALSPDFLAAAAKRLK